jgi:hypothetical protein
MSKKGEGRVMQQLMPKFGDIKSYTSYTKEQQEYRDRLRQEVANVNRAKIAAEGPATFVNKASDIFGGTPMGPSGPIGTPGYGLPQGAGPVPVHIASVDAAAVIGIRGAEGLISAGYVAPKTTKDIQNLFAINDELKSINESENRLSELIKKMDVSGSMSKDSISYEDYFSPSRLSAGGKMSGQKTPLNEVNRLKEQLDSIVDKMTTKEDMSEYGKMNVDWGTAIHTKLEKQLKGFDNIETEKYGEISNAVDSVVDGIVGGTADIIEYTDSSKSKINKIVDIKTTFPDKFKKLEEAYKSSGQTGNFFEMYDHLDDDTKRVLEEYYSQLNTYLKIFDETATAEVRFFDKTADVDYMKDYIPVRFDFDPERFKDDMKQIKAARDIIRNSDKEFLSGTRRTSSDSEEANISMEEIDEALGILRSKYYRMNPSATFSR